MTLFGENTEKDKLANDLFNTIRHYWKSADRLPDLRHLTAYEVLQALAMTANYVAEHWEATELVPDDDPPRIPQFDDFKEYVTVLLDVNGSLIGIFRDDIDVANYFSKIDDHIIVDDQVLVNGCVEYRIEREEIKYISKGGDN